MLKSTRFVAFMSSLFLTHGLMFAVLFVAPKYMQPVVLSGYGFLSAFGLVTGGSKIAEKWRQNDN